MVISDWDAYWRNAQSAAAHKDGGPQDKVLERFWVQLFNRVLPGFQKAPTMLDVACGNGAVARFALASVQRLGEGTNLSISGVDESPAALQEMRKRHPDLYAIAAGAAHLPFQDGTYDIVTSQFGVEYAGPDALMEAARVVRPGGVIAAVLHMRDGGIYRECATNLEAIDGFRNCNLLHCFEGLFAAVLAMQEKRGGRKLLRDADKKFAGSVVAAEDVLRRWGKRVADGMLFRLYTDVAHMYGRLAAYEPNEVFAWIRLMAKELDAYSGRMASMLQAALDVQQLDRAIAQLTNRGFAIRVHDTLNMGRSAVPAAWVVVAERGPG